MLDRHSSFYGHKDYNSAGMYKISSLFLFLVTLAISCQCVCCIQTVYYIKPINESAADCPTVDSERNSTCITLDQYATIQDRPENSILRLLHGNHSLSSNITVTNFSSLYMQRANTTIEVFIHCSEPAFLMFEYFATLEINGIHFASCGVEELSAVTVKSASSVKLINVTMEHCVSGGLVVNESSVRMWSVKILNSGGFGSKISHSSVSMTGDSAFAGNSRGGILVNSSMMTFTSDSTTTFIKNEGERGGAISATNSAIISYGRISFINNSATVSGGALFSEWSKMSFLGSTKFKNNSARYGGAIFVGFGELLCSGILEMSSNTAKEDGGGIHTKNGSLLFTKRAYFMSNTAVRGGGIFVQYNQVNFSGNITLSSNKADFGGGVMLLNSQLLSNRTTLFDQNQATIAGGGLCYESSSIRFSGNTTLFRNSAKIGAAIFAGTSTTTLGDVTTIENNSASTSGGGVYLEKSHIVVIGPVIFIANSARYYGGAVYVGDSNVSFTGDIVLTNNSALNGGAVFFTGITLCKFMDYGNVTFSYNKANDTGGAILVSEYSPYIVCPDSSTVYAALGIEFCCHLRFGSNLSSIHLFFDGNSAGQAGSVLYGGSLDRCIDCSSHLTGRQVFHTISTIKNELHNVSNISSDPYRICPCSNGVKICSVSKITRTVYPGMSFLVSLVVVGQLNGTVPASVQSHVRSASDYRNSSQLGRHQGIQLTRTTCSDAEFTVFSSSSWVEIELQPDGICSKLSKTLRINVTLSNCSTLPGFVLSNAENGNYSCTCEERLLRYTQNCDINTMMIQRHGNFWMGYVKPGDSGIILHSYCPSDYCTTDTLEINKNNSDLQCNYNRTGLLCGSCSEGLSVVLGSSRCKKCSYTYLLLVVAFILAGIALVYFVIKAKLTIAAGAVNGLIIYANVVYPNRTIFLPAAHTDNVLSVILAWINLDLGIETCFFNGMDAYFKAWLQFVFPVYLWVLCGILVYASKSPRVLMCFKDSNPVAILGTVLLLSYTKILRAIIAAVLEADLSYPNSTEKVWLYDASVHYLHGKHIPLFLTATVVFFFLFLPYTLVLFTGQWIHMKPISKLLSARNTIRINILLDPYHAPYKPKHRYWPGFLLLLRAAAAFLVVFTGTGVRKMLLLLSVITGLSAGWQWTVGGLYKDRLNDALEASIVVNMNILAIATLYFRDDNPRKQRIIGYTSISMALLTFIGVTLYQRVKTTNVWRKLCNRNRCNSDLPPMIESRDDCETGDESTSNTDEERPLIRSRRSLELTHTATDEY